MKNYLVLIGLLCSLSSFSQNGEETEVRNIVIAFFEAFHRQDTIALRSLAHPEIRMQSIGRNAQEEMTLMNTSYRDFLKSIRSIPNAINFEEKLHGFQISVNGPLATVITPYTFYLEGELSHCGINSFTMVKEAQEWQILYLIDTRRKKDCDLYD